MSSLTGSDEVLTKQDLQNYHERILPYLNGITAIDNTFDISNLHSTEEKMIGQWIDGKPLYQKTIQCTIPSTTTDGVPVLNNTAIGETIDNCISAIGFFKSSGGNCVFLPAAINAIDSSKMGIGRIVVRTNTGSPANNISLQNTYTAYNGLIAYVILQYTKTTDSAMQVPFGSVNDYSTTERIVGTWIDGKPLYQKTISCGALPNATIKQVAHGISNISKIIDTKGISTSGTYTIPLPYPNNDTTKVVVLYADATNIVIGTGSDVSVYSTTYVTIQYTKTTD